MADIDLIPNDYRNWLGQQAILRKYAVGIAVLCALIVVVAVVLGQTAQRAQARVLQLKSENAITQQQQLQLQQLKEQSGIWFLDARESTKQHRNWPGGLCAVSWTHALGRGRGQALAQECSECDRPIEALQPRLHSHR